MTVTDKQIQAMVVESLKGRQNAHKRALRVDAAAALAGSAVAREVMAIRLAKTRQLRVELPQDLIETVEKFLDTDWSDGRDPSKIGALNAVSYIGERVAALVAEARKARR